jgi:hypothetical protein
VTDERSQLTIVTRSLVSVWGPVLPLGIYARDKAAAPW